MNTKLAYKKPPIPDIPACVEKEELYRRGSDPALQNIPRNGGACPTSELPQASSEGSAVPPSIRHIDLAEQGVNLLGRYAAKLAEAERMRMNEKLRACKAEQQLRDAKRIMETGLIQEGIEGAVAVLEAILFRYDETELCRECDCPKLAGFDFCVNCDSGSPQHGLVRGYGQCLVSKLEIAIDNTFCEYDELEGRA